MIPATNIRTVSTRGVRAGAEFGISVADSAHIMTILRDTLYSDKVMAVLREYSANAWDSHRTSGKGNLPIDVHIPTANQPVLSIRDHGTGLSRDDVFNVYTQYGASTKRDSDTAVGMLGIGCKSGFAYSDTFTVTSWFGGTKSVYSAMLDPTDKGLISLIGEEPCGDETGIMIEIPVKIEDIPEFVRKASKLFVHFDPRPKINLELEEQPKLIGKFPEGVLFPNSDYSDGDLIAVMGCVPYRINLDQVRSFEEGLPSFMMKLNGQLFFDIGEVHINASREELKYSDQTKRAIINKLTTLVDSYVKSAVTTILDPKSDSWTRRLMAQSLRFFGDFVPKDAKKYTEYSVNLSKHIPCEKIVTGKDPAGKVIEKDEPLFWLSDERRRRTDSIVVRDGGRIIVKDNGKSMKGFDLHYNDVVVHRGKLRYPNEVIFKAVKKMVKQAEIDGVKIIKTSEMPWTPPRGHVERKANLKHGQKVFRFERSNASYNCGRGRKSGRTPSESWESVTHTASETDVYVEIEHFRVDYDIVAMYDSDMSLALEFGITMPDVFGYKVTKREPSQKRPGTEYREWRKILAKQVVDHKKFAEVLERRDWEKILDSYYYSQKVDTASLIGELGKDHEICKFFIDRTKALANRNTKSSDAVEKVQRILGKLDENMMPATKRLNQIHEKYVLFSCEGVSLERLGVKSELKKWADYIRMVDNKGDKP